MDPQAGSGFTGEDSRRASLFFRAAFVSMGMLGGWPERPTESNGNPYAVMLSQ
jgi:hypothetical protein